MNEFGPADVFALAERPERLGDLYTADDATELEAALLHRLELLPPGGVLVVDFNGVRIASDAARRLLGRAVRRIGGGGELEDRYIVITRVGLTSYNVEVMLEREGLTVVQRTADGSSAQLMGRLDPAVKETYEFLRKTKTATAHDVHREFNQTIQAATNRLTKLFRLGLARRVAQEAASGGGRQFVYAALT
jgi:hypothetical protein